MLLLAGCTVLAQTTTPTPGTPPASSLGDELVHQVQDMALSGAAGSPVAQGLPVRFAVEVGSLDPRLKLAPCQRIEPFLPAGARAWGSTRIGLRCTQGPTLWTVYLPVTVKAFTAGWVAAAPLTAGTQLDATHLMQGEVDLAAGAGTALLLLDSALGRTLARPLAAGAALRSTDLRQRQWFAAGDTVRVSAGGAGFQVEMEGQAMNPGIEGQTVRVRVEGGRTVQGRVAGEKRVEVSL